MSYLVEIAHANDVLFDRWKAVDTLQNVRQIKDIIESPSFEWQRTTVVRVARNTKIFYTGIYAEDTCIDVGPGSQFMEMNSWSYDEKNSPYRSQDLTRRWIDSKHPSDMAHGISKIIDKKVMILFMVDLIKSTMLPLFDTLPLAIEALSVLEDYLAGKASVERVTQMANDLYDSIDGGEDWSDAVAGTCNFLTDPMGCASALYMCISAGTAIDQKSYADSASQIADRMRREISFYDIALGVTA